MEEPMTCLIVDDEPPARELLKYYLGKIPGIEVVGECANGFEALKLISALQPQLIFLDIQMPKINGFELLELLDDPPEVIFCTAYDEFALKAFELHAVDYLLKPFAEERLCQSVKRALERISTSSGAESERYEKLAWDTVGEAGKAMERIVVKTGTRITVVPVEQVRYFEAQGDYVLVVSEQGSHLKEKTMKYYEQRLSSDLFVRIHRSFMVNISYIKTIALYGKESYRVKLTTGEELKASASGYRLLRKMI